MQHRDESSTTDDFTLPIDAEGARLLNALAEPDSPKQHRELLLQALEDSTRQQIAVGRTLRRDLRLLEEKEQQRAILMASVDQAEEPIRARIREAERFFERLMAMRREAGLGNSFDVPTVGRWVSRRQPERWAIDDARLIAEALGPDERAQFTEPVPPKPQPDKFLGAKFREHLDGLVDAMIGAWPVERVAEMAAMDADASAALMNDVKRQVAAVYAGVEHVPSEVKVAYDIIE